ncbi:hypothetical protein PHLCEN_2v8248 [Hermanssonia centrifuga]|uniref:Uncharacterized protein n=1 Tax=Hermanssonia centrifuga TaxID=98765 RepID=A0A2R6NTZ7_9APHY|nr:hypothetical protein PHLCEN_2v8248 [Hermanssonia centrifuga]
MDIHQYEFRIDNSSRSSGTAGPTLLLPGCNRHESRMVRSPPPLLSPLQRQGFTEQHCRLANFGTFLALASYSRHRIKEEEKGQDGVITKKLRKANKKGGANHKMKVAAMLQTFLSMILTIITWAKPDAFQLINSDGNPDVACNVDFKYVAFFAVSFPASESHPGKLSPGQKLGLTVSVMLMIVYAAVTVHETFSYTRRKRHPLPSDPEAQRQDEGDGPAVPPKVIITPAVPMPEPSFELLQANSPAPSIMLSQRSHSSLGGFSIPPSISEPPTRPRGPRRPPPKPPFREVDPMFLGITMVQTIIFVYFIVVTELLLKRNKQADNSGGLWGFGQILALIVIVPSLISVLTALQEFGLKRVHHRRSRGRREHHRDRSGSGPRYFLPHSGSSVS